MKGRDVLHVTCVWLFVVTLLILSYYQTEYAVDFSTTPRFSASRLEDWLRQQRARVNWQGMMESCKDDMAWNPVKWDKIHRSDASTSEIVSWDIRPAGEFSKIFIQSKTSDHRTKLIDKLKGLDYYSRTCKHLWDGFGRWTKDKWEPLLEESNNSPMLPEGDNKPGTLWIYGDSLANNLFDSVIKLPLCTKVYSRCRLSYNWVYRPVWGVGRLDELPNDDLDIQLDKFIGYIVDVLRKPEMQSYDSTLLLNIGLHMGSTVNFTTYQKLIGDLINTLKEATMNSRGESGVSKYKASVIWKSTTVVRHKRKAIVFLTTQRILLFNAYATSAMCKAGFDVIDVYPMTDSNPEALKDHALYTKLDGFYDTVATSLEKYKIKKMLTP